MSNTRAKMAQACLKASIEYEVNKFINDGSLAFANKDDESVLSKIFDSVVVNVLGFESYKSYKEVAEMNSSASDKIPFTCGILTHNESIKEEVFIYKTESELKDLIKDIVIDKFNLPTNQDEWIGHLLYIFQQLYLCETYCAKGKTGNDQFVFPAYLKETLKTHFKDQITHAKTKDRAVELLKQATDINMFNYQELIDFIQSM